MFSVTLGVRWRNCEWHCIKPSSPPPTFSFHHASKVKSIFLPRGYLTDEPPKAYQPISCLSLHYARDRKRKSFVQVWKKTMALWGIIILCHYSHTLTSANAKVPYYVNAWAFYSEVFSNIFQHFGMKCPRLYDTIKLAKDLFLALWSKRVNHLPSPHLNIPSPNCLLGTVSGWCCSQLKACTRSGRALVAMAHAWHGHCTKQHEHS